MTETYQTMKNRQQRELDSLPIKWAFSDKQFKEALSEMGLTLDDTHLLIRVPGGGFMRKTEKHLLKKTFTRHEQELQAAIDHDPDGSGFIFDMFDYELGNHEYCITHDIEPALDALGIDQADVEKNPALQNGLRLALQEQREKHPVP
jgi:hypothetical protein